MKPELYLVGTSYSNNIRYYKLLAYPSCKVRNFSEEDLQFLKPSYVNFSLSDTGSIRGLTGSLKELNNPSAITVLRLVGTDSCRIYTKGKVSICKIAELSDKGTLLNACLSENGDLRGIYWNIPQDGNMIDADDSITAYVQEISPVIQDSQEEKTQAIQDSQSAKTKGTPIKSDDKQAIQNPQKPKTQGTLLRGENNSTKITLISELIESDDVKLSNGDTLSKFIKNRQGIITIPANVNSFVDADLNLSDCWLLRQIERFIFQGSNFSGDFCKSALLYINSVLKIMGITPAYNQEQRFIDSIFLARQKYKTSIPDSDYLSVMSDALDLTKPELQEFSSCCRLYTASKAYRLLRKNKTQVRGFSNLDVMLKAYQDKFITYNPRKQVSVTRYVGDLSDLDSHSSDFILELVPSMSIINPQIASSDAYLLCKSAPDEKFLNLVAPMTAWFDNACNTDKYLSEIHSAQRVLSIKPKVSVINLSAITAYDQLLIKKLFDIQITPSEYSIIPKSELASKLGITKDQATTLEMFFTSQSAWLVCRKLRDTVWTQQAIAGNLLNQGTITSLLRELMPYTEIYTKSNVKSLFR